MRVVLADVDCTGMEETAAAISQQGASVLAVDTDVADPRAVDRLADAAEAAFGPVALLVNNAGVMMSGPAWATPLADWQQAMGVNVMGVVHGLHSFVPRMIDAGSAAHIVNTASVAGLLSGPGMAAYSASKHAIVALSESLHHDLRLARAPIGVSVLCPGFVPTRLLEVGRYRHESGAQSDDAVASRTRRIERQIAQAPLTADDVAARTMDAVLDGTFYVLTHPGSDAALEAHAAAIHDRRAPPMARL